MHNSWFTCKEEKRDGVDVITPLNCDKDGGMVYQRYASALGTPAVSYTRHMYPQHVPFNADENPLEIMASKTCNLYDKLNSTHLNKETVVIGTPHRVSLYISEVMHAPLLPGGFIAFAENWEEAVQLTSSGTRAITQVGGDYGYNNLWLWLKIAPGKIPTAYKTYLNEAKQCVIVRDTSKCTSPNVVGIYKGMYITSATRGYNNPNQNPNWYEKIKSEIKEPTQSEVEEFKNLRQWEWGLPDKTVEALRECWTKELGKESSKFIVVEYSTIPLYFSIPLLWEKYLEMNEQKINGFTINAYWSAHPSYERAAGLVPLHFYYFGENGFVVYNFFKSKLEEYKNNGMEFEPSTCCAFVNSTGRRENKEIGVKGDPKSVQSLLEELGISDKCHFFDGYDCPDDRNKKLPTDSIAKWWKDIKYREFTKALTIQQVQELLAQAERIYLSDKNVQRWTK